MEIVSEPDLRTAEEVKAYGEKLRAILHYLGVDTGDMEKGVIRFEPNISIRPVRRDRIRLAHGIEEPQFVPRIRTRHRLRVDAASESGE